MNATSGRRVRGRPARHRQPEHPPADDAQHRQQVGQPLGRPELGLLGPAARLQHLVIGLDLPPHRVPVQLLDGRGEVVHRQVGEQLPPDRLPARRRAPLAGRGSPSATTAGSASAWPTAGGRSSGRTARGRVAVETPPVVVPDLDLVDAPNRLVVSSPWRPSCRPGRPADPRAVRTRKCVPRLVAAQNSSKMSPSRSPTWTHRRRVAQLARVDRFRFSSQRTLSFCSIGTRRRVDRPLAGVRALERLARSRT